MEKKKHQHIIIIMYKMLEAGKNVERQKTRRAHTE